jgi:hypothetical protein
MQTGLLNSGIEEAISLLREAGYVVIAPKTINDTSVKNAKQLVDFFYAYLQYRYPNRILHHYGSDKKDSAIASKFIKHRMSSGATKKRAIQECCLIIKTIIDNEDVIGLDEPLSSVSILGQNELKWVTDKAISIINKESAKYNELELKRIEEELCKQQEKEALEEIDDENVENLREILGGFISGKEKR